MLLLIANRLLFISEATKPEQKSLKLYATRIKYKSIIGTQEFSKNGVSKEMAAKLCTFIIR
jgi:hypothetical protein